MTTTRKVHIFLAEDNSADVWLIEEALNREHLNYELLHYTTAEDAAEGAAACGTGGAPVPDVMLLDFNLPRGDGRDVLAAAALNPHLARVPKVIISSFLRPEEMQQALQLGALCFLAKPADFESFLSTVGGKIVELLQPAPG